MARARFKVTLEPPDHDMSSEPIRITTPELEPPEVVSLIAYTMALRPTDEWAIHIRQIP